MGYNATKGSQTLMVMRQRVSTITYQQEMCTQIKIECNSRRACSAD